MKYLVITAKTEDDGLFKTPSKLVCFFLEMNENYNFAFESHRFTIFNIEKALVDYSDSIHLFTKDNELVGKIKSDILEYGNMESLFNVITNQREFSIRMSYAELLQIEIFDTKEEAELYMELQG